MTTHPRPLLHSHYPAALGAKPRMDTTFKSSEGHHDVHRAAYPDCHPAGVPKKKPVAD
jgi:hypothetical protein